ncbi:MAG: Tetratricopeptide repeat protein [candidate division WS6 bacterium OLB21]|uniref:Tetratricopeptide repeat protein n=1 Tax=candidate division WS6 bacterium OLB21 TaxID=1617427 RepID=A0A136KFY7_9BACT|nr:MAG: Tetratricopeptide repeat protein [candidate division WS6 bacterium OLB21]
MFGAGPQTFSVAFSNFKPIEFNNNDFWNLRFNSSAQEIFNIVQATGLLGLTALVWLIGSVTRVVVTETRLLRKESVRSRYELVAIGATLIFVFLLLFVIPFQALGWITLFLLLAMFVASYYHLYPKEQGLNNIVLSSFSETDKKKGTVFVAKLAALSMVLFVVAFAWMFARRYSADIELRQSLGYLQSGNLQEAIRHAQLATTYAPDQAYIQRNLAIISVRYADLIATSETDEANIDQTLQLVEGLIRQSVYSIQTAVTLNPFDVESQESAAQIYATIFNFTNNTRYGNETLASLRNSITVEPFNPNHFVNLGLFLYRNGKTSEAEVALRNAYNLRPDYSASVLTLGSILEEKEDKTEAEDLYNAVLAFPNISEDSEFGKELRRRLTTLGDNTLGGSSSESNIQEQVIPSEESNLELE